MRKGGRHSDARVQDALGALAQLARIGVCWGNIDTWGYLCDNVKAFDRTYPLAKYVAMLADDRAGGLVPGHGAIQRHVVGS